MSTKRIPVLVAGLLLSVGIVSPAHAYLDPGTGSLIVQSLLGGIAGAMAIVALYWRKLVGFFTGRGKAREDAGTAGDKD